MKAPHPIPYQGSKRHLASAILRYFPPTARRLFEPFAGGGAISIASALHGRVDSIVMNDVNFPLMELWRKIIASPIEIASAYRHIWQGQLGKEREFYDFVRDRFNQHQRPEDLLYLLLRCVKASVRYNSSGEFNQSPDNRRLGMKPDTLSWHVSSASQLLKGMTEIVSMDYRRALANTTIDDLVYMDPPYQGVCGTRDQRYLGNFDPKAFEAALDELNNRGISYILSYDGRTGARVYGKPLPATLQLTRMEIEAGRSSQATLLGDESVTVESIYLSAPLVKRLGGVSEGYLTPRSKQLTLGGWSSENFHESSSTA